VTRYRIAVIIGVGAGLLMNLGSALGQSTFGSILGTVQDPSGAAVALCKVTIQNKGTSTQRAALADQTGNYVVTNLDPGNYEVTFEAPGFQRTVAEVELLARQTARIDGHLPVASQTEMNFMGLPSSCRWIRSSMIMPAMLTRLP